MEDHYPILLTLGALFAGLAFGRDPEAVQTNAILLGLSMIPRAEIALVVVYQCSKLDGELVSDEVFAAMVVVSLVSSILSPLLLRRTLS